MSETRPDISSLPVISKRVKPDSPRIQAKVEAEDRVLFVLAGGDQERLIKKMEELNYDYFAVIGHFVSPDSQKRAEFLAEKLRRLGQSAVAVADGSKADDVSDEVIVGRVPVLIQDKGQLNLLDLALSDLEQPPPKPAVKKEAVKKAKAKKRESPKDWVKAMIGGEWEPPDPEEVANIKEKIAEAEEAELIKNVSVPKQPEPQKKLVTTNFNLDSQNPLPPQMADQFSVADRVTFRHNKVAFGALMIEVFSRELEALPKAKIGQSPLAVGDVYNDKINLGSTTKVSWGLNKNAEIRINLPIQVTPTKVFDASGLIVEIGNVSPGAKKQAEAARKTLQERLGDIHTRINEVHRDQLNPFGVELDPVMEADIAGGFIETTHTKVQPKPKQAVPAEQVEEKPKRRPRATWGYEKAGAKNTIKYSPENGPVFEQLDQAMDQGLIFNLSAGGDEAPEILESMANKLIKGFKVGKIEVTNLDTTMFIFSCPVTKGLSVTPTISVISHDGKLFLDEVTGISPAIKFMAKLLKIVNIDIVSNRYKTLPLNGLIMGRYNSSREADKGKVEAVKVNFKQGLMEISFIPVRKLKETATSQ